MMSSARTVRGATGLRPLRFHTELVQGEQAAKPGDCVSTLPRARSIRKLARVARESSRTLAALVLAVLGGNLVAHAQNQTVVGAFELGAPQVTNFVLRGTLPVPPDTFPRADGKTPFGVLDYDGTLIPAQCEAVSYYPDQQGDGADVVEVLARVRLAPGTAPGTRVQYRVVDFVHGTSATQLTPNVQQLFATPNAVQIRSRDCFGNRYSADLLRGLDGKKSLRNGRYATQVRNYEMMRPIGGTQGPPNGPLPHLMGVHSYVTTWDGENMFSVDLRIHNGPSGLDKQNSIDDPQDNLYFDSIDIRVPTGWTVLYDWRDPFIGAPIPLGAFVDVPLLHANTDGTLHVIPPQSQFHRRLVIVRLGNEVRARSLLNEQWIGFCRRGQSPNSPLPLYSWWNRQTARYFPQRHRLPELDHIAADASRAMLANDLAKITGPLISGSYNAGPIFSPVLGWAHPWGVQYGGMTSGTEIYLYDGVVTADCASAEGYRLAQLSLRLYTERHPVALYNKDGNFTQVNQWVIHGAQHDYVPMQFFLVLLPSSNDPFGFDIAPLYQVNYVKSNNLDPHYESELAAYKPIDLQHGIRFTRNAKVLTWLGNDALAKDELRAQAEVVRLSYHEYYTSAAGGKIPTSLLQDQLDVASQPGWGFKFGRGEGWDIDTVNAAYSIAEPSWRALVRPWYDKVVNVVRDGQSTCTGTIMRVLSNKVLNGAYHGRKATEQAILENMLWGVLESVYRDVDPAREATLRDILKKSLYSLINFPSWHPNHGPWEGLAVSPRNPDLPPYCNVIPPNGHSAQIDGYLCWSSFGYGYELTGDPVFLARAAELSSNTSNLLNALKLKKWDNLENRVALFSVVLALYGP
jgi:hypothetical protein